MPCRHRPLESCSCATERARPRDVRRRTHGGWGAEPRADPHRAADHRQPAARDARCRPAGMQPTSGSPAHRPTTRSFAHSGDASACWRAPAVAFEEPHGGAGAVGRAPLRSFASCLLPARLASFQTSRRALAFCRMCCSGQRPGLTLTDMPLGDPRAELKSPTETESTTHPRRSTRTLSCWTATGATRHHDPRPLAERARAIVDASMKPDAVLVNGPAVRFAIRNQHGPPQTEPLLLLSLSRRKFGVAIGLPRDCSIQARSCSQGTQPEDGRDSVAQAKSRRVTLAKR